MDHTAKAIADKLDCGHIMLPIREGDNAIIESVCSKGFETKPDMVMHIYKVRRGSWNNIRLYVHFDKGTCRLEDCFVTDNNGKLLDIEDTDIKQILDETKEEKPPEQENSFGFSF